MFLLARIRVTLARHPSIYWLVVALLGAVMVTCALGAEPCRSRSPVVGRLPYRVGREPRHRAR